MNGCECSVSVALRCSEIRANSRKVTNRADGQILQRQPDSASLPRPLRPRQDVAAIVSLMRAWPRAQHSLSTPSCTPVSSCGANSGLVGKGSPKAAQLLGDKPRST